MSCRNLAYIPPCSHHFSGREVIFSPATRSFIRGKASGGLLIILKKSEYLCNVLHVSGDMIFVRMSNSKLNFILGVIYKTPNSDIKLFCDKISDTFDGINAKFYSLPVIIGGYFNSRIGELNQLDDDILPNNVNILSSRLSLDKVANKKGEMLVDCMENNDCIVLNGSTKADTPGNYTFISKIGKSLIDLVWTSLQGLLIIENLEICDIVTKSDHFPVIVTINKLIKSRNKIIRKIK